MANKTAIAGPMIVALLVVVVVLPAVSQESSVKGNLGGLAVDTAGAAVPGAIVTITGAMGTKTGRTDDAGSFLFSRLIPGFYSVKVEKSGFRTASVNAVEIVIGKTQMVRVTLPGEVLPIRFSEGAVALECVGNGNSGAISNQFGYFSYVAGLSAFHGTPEDEAHANFTFFTDALTQRVTSNGALRIVDRTGTTSVYLSTSPASFSEPDSFRRGSPVQVSTMRQQMIIDTTTGDFTAVNVNTVTQIREFALGGKQYQLGEVGDRFHTMLRGKTNAAATPGFFMAGYAVGAGKQ
jgi:Carboxypeptidase regulatory-like domain